MSLYFQKKRGWKYDFVKNKERHTSKYFKTKTEAREAENQKREELKKPATPMQTDMVFLDLINLRLDYVKVYNSVKYYTDVFYMACRWVKIWESFMCEDITYPMIQNFILERAKVSPNTANKEIRYLRATFNFGKKKRYILNNPVDGIDFLPIDKKKKYVPPPEDIDKIIEIAVKDTQDYLWTIRETLGRMSEINQLTWEDINFDTRYVILYTRKKKGGHRTPRYIPMTNRLYDVLKSRYEMCDMTKPWVYWHKYYSTKAKEWVIGPYIDRKKFMKTLCKNAGVKYFRFHAIRHSGASVMENNNVPIGAIQEILGHEKRSTTEIYLHNLSGASRKAIHIYEHAIMRNKLKSHSKSHSP